MSPEQIEGKEADARSDIFAFGAVLYEMAAGKRPFAGKSQLSLASSILENDPEPISSIKPQTPPAFEHVTKTCLQKNPEERYLAAHDIKLELQWIASDRRIPLAAASGRLPSNALADKDRLGRSDYRRHYPGRDRRNLIQPSGSICPIHPHGHRRSAKEHAQPDRRLRRSPGPLARRFIHRVCGHRRRRQNRTLGSADEFARSNYALRHRERDFSILVARRSLSGILRRWATENH